MYADEVQPLFEERCREGCHEPDGFNGELFLGGDFGQEDFVGVQSNQASMSLVEPGNLEESYLWHKLQATHRDAGGEGEAMPYAEWPLPDEELAVVEDYILAL